MNIIAVDDERIALQVLVTEIEEAMPEAEVHGFESGENALSFVGASSCQIAFLDVDMVGMNGIVLARQLKKINPIINIVFVTAHSKYAAEAVSLYISGYVMKPVTKEKIEQEIENLRHPVTIKSKQPLWIQCFGNFEVFAGGEAISFRYSKTKELLAYLIDREGALCSNGEIIATLWEEAADVGKKGSYLRELRADMLSVFRAHGAENALRHKRGFMAVVPSNVDCDYYRWRQGDIKAINTYRGEYMSQYSWGEMTLGGLEFINPPK